MKKNRRKRNRISKIKSHIHYGIAILIMLFVIVGLTTAIKGRGIDDVFKENGTQETEIKEKVAEQGEKTVKEQEKANPIIRVLIMTDGFRYTVHSQVKLSADSKVTVTYGKHTKEYGKKKIITIKPDSKLFQEGKVRVQAKEGKIKIRSITRGDGVPEYDGILELIPTAEGIVIVNELPVEDYLCGVVPSEMPASYELEALKAQAVCARSYAYRQMENYGYPEYKAHVNDSTDYQVYNNSAQAESSEKAVEETFAETVRYRGKVVATYYYSTSCGYTTNMEAWGTKPSKENGYLKSVKVSGENGDYEKKLPWYRWKVTISGEKLSDLIELNTGKKIGTLKKIKVTKRGPGNVAVCLKVTGEEGSVKVETENKIRRIFGGEGYEIVKQDGSRIPSMELLPSAFFEIQKKGTKFVINGGGFGHGIGMSQTGANEMAKQGKDYKEILTLFYNDITVE
ncbi:MAG: SpoIID/LytB domain-containing protein [Lachnospiraceae bacterium]